MPTTRLEAFSDGVLAIIITIIVLELPFPKGDTFHALLADSGSGILTYLLSFVNVGIYWNNHHHLLSLAERTSGKSLWANLSLLFSLSLLPFTTHWMDDTNFAQDPTTAYGLNLIAAAITYTLLQASLFADHAPDSALRRTVQPRAKIAVSIGLYLVGVLASALGRGSHVTIGIALACYAIVAAIWVIPDRRVERAVRELRR
ncbi:MAG: DUF1211 domain-containing protein [Nocardia sp.]|nr:DUF1211 domain-containing protein [Nocardia sp.]